MLPTLKGVFPEPKSQPKRNFLRENKMHLKELQRSSSRQQQLRAEEERKLTELQRQQRNRSLDKAGVMSRGRPISGNSGDYRSTGAPLNSGRSVATVKEKIAMSSREVQTDDIVDEEFLYQALKRCSSVEVQRDKTPREATGQRENYLNSAVASETASQCGRDYNDRDLDLQSLRIDCEAPPPSARSSTQLTSRRSQRRPHELGDRQNVPLPKYLEREKLDKELQRQHELQRDVNCPPGYAPVAETERKSTLASAQKKFQDLVDELNHMPMTTQTLRMRTRKAEIERILTELEAEIRIFSKPKVYMKLELPC